MPVDCCYAPGYLYSDGYDCSGKTLTSYKKRRIAIQSANRNGPAAQEVKARLGAEKAKFEEEIAEGMIKMSLRDFRLDTGSTELLPHL